MSSLPSHITMIMDGNGRWAKARGLPRTAGHREGAKTVRLMMEACLKHHIPVLSLFAFSTENWKRPKRLRPVAFEGCDPRPYR
jgi:undecaprenyl diphosphate synthase